MIDVTFKSELDPIATGALILSCLSLVWQIISHLRAGPRLKLRVMCPAVAVGGYVDSGDEFIALTVTNVGDRATTITTVAVKYWDKPWMKYLRFKPDKSMIVTYPYFNNDPTSLLPKVLEAGKDWTGKAELNENIRAMINDGILIIEVYDSVNSRPISERLTL